MNPPSTILALASKQIWPHVLTVLRYRPQRLVLLHSEDNQESRLPAKRLKRFFENVEVSPGFFVQLRQLSHNDFSAIEQQLDKLSNELQDPKDAALNFTGGNKLMATAAFRWASRRNLRAFYLERGNLITWFNPGAKDILTSQETLDPSITDSLDPLALLRCQLDSSEVEREGERLTLNETGAALPAEDLFRQAEGGVDSKRFLEVSGRADAKRKEGDPLELATAAVLLKLSVNCVRRNLRLKVKSSPGVSSTHPHAEVDLLFNWAGRLWLVDCKDRKPAEDLADALGGLARPRSVGDKERFSDLMARIKSELLIGQTKALKEDILAIREIGGLLGEVICVRKSPLPDEVVQYARSNRIAIIAKNELASGLERLLFPDRPARDADLMSLRDSLGRRP
jgi:hypothetical protein